MKLEIDVEEWAAALGPAVILMAYFQTENARDWDRWHELVADDATHTANVDSSGLSRRRLKHEIIDGVIGSMPDFHARLRSVRTISDSAAIAEWEAAGTLPNDVRYENSGFIKCELSADGQVQNMIVAEFSIDAIDLLREVGGVVEGLDD